MLAWIEDAPRPRLACDGKGLWFASSRPCIDSPKPPICKDLNGCALILESAAEARFSGHGKVAHLSRLSPLCCPHRLLGRRPTRSLSPARGRPRRSPRPSPGLGSSFFRPLQFILAKHAKRSRRKIRKWRREGNHAVRFTRRDQSRPRWRVFAGGVWGGAPSSDPRARLRGRAVESSRPRGAGGVWAELAHARGKY